MLTTAKNDHIHDVYTTWWGKGKQAGRPSYIVVKVPFSFFYGFAVAIKYILYTVLTSKRDRFQINLNIQKVKYVLFY